MKKIAALLILSSLSLHADLKTISPTENGIPPAAMNPSPLQDNFTTYMMIDPKQRALDYQQAYEMLRKEKTTGKVFFQLSNGSTISNIIDLTLMPNGTLMVFRYNTMQGIKLQLVAIEEIVRLVTIDMGFHFLELHHYPIGEQLKLEERLLRSDTRNWCLINRGSPRAIVMGISGKKEELVDLEKANRDQIPILKRFSGGGTVIVDENTLFVTFICQKELHPFPAYPEPIMKWTEEIYREAFAHELFRLRENDFVWGERKCGGNAQYIKKNRWLQHTSFLWDYSRENMQYLLHPKKTPAYRAGRTHEEFLCTLKEHFADSALFAEKITDALGKRYPLHRVGLDEVSDVSSATIPFTNSSCFS